MIVVGCFLLLLDLEEVLEMVDGIVFVFVVFSILMRCQGWKAIFRIEYVLEQSTKGLEGGEFPQKQVEYPWQGRINLR